MAETSYPGDPGPDTVPFVDTRILDDAARKIIGSIAAPIWPAIGSTINWLDPHRVATVKDVTLQFEFDKPGAFIAIVVDVAPDS